MARNNPVVLPLLLTVTSLILAIDNWDDIPSSLPLWWSAFGHPILWVPKWLGLLLFPFLQFVIPYIIYQVACRDPDLKTQSGESSYAVANIIVLPSVLIFMVFVLIIVPSALSDSNDFLPRVFTTNVAVWALLWLGYNIQYVDPNSSIGVPIFFRNAEPEHWRTIHARSGVVLIVSGIILFIFALACPIGLEYFVITIVIWIGAYVLTILDSYMVFRIVRGPVVANSKERSSSDGAAAAAEEPLIVESA